MEVENSSLIPNFVRKKEDNIHYLKFMIICSIIQHHPIFYSIALDFLQDYWHSLEVTILI